MLMSFRPPLGQGEKQTVLEVPRGDGKSNLKDVCLMYVFHCQLFSFRGRLRSTSKILLTQPVGTPPNAEAYWIRKGRSLGHNATLRYCRRDEVPMTSSNLIVSRFACLLQRCLRRDATCFISSNPQFGAIKRPPAERKSRIQLASRSACSSSRILSSIKHGTSSRRRCKIFGRDQSRLSTTWQQWSAGVGSHCRVHEYWEPRMGELGAGT